MSEIDYSGLPERYREGMRRYVEHGVRPGSFLFACLSNMFCNAVCQADDDLSADDLRKIARWIYSEPPSECWGLQSKVVAWTEKRQEAANV